MRLLILTFLLLSAPLSANDFVFAQHATTYHINGLTANHSGFINMTTPHGIIMGAVTDVRVNRCSRNGLYQSTGLDYYTMFVSIDHREYRCMQIIPASNQLYTFTSTDPGSNCSFDLISGDDAGEFLQDENSLLDALKSFFGMHLNMTRATFRSPSSHQNLRINGFTPSRDLKLNNVLLNLLKEAVQESQHRIFYTLSYNATARQFILKTFIKFSNIFQMTGKTIIDIKKPDAQTVSYTINHNKHSIPFFDIHLGEDFNWDENIPQLIFSTNIIQND